MLCPLLKISSLQRKSYALGAPEAHPEEKLPISFTVIPNAGKLQFEEQLLDPPNASPGIFANGENGWKCFSRAGTQRYGNENGSHV